MTRQEVNNIELSHPSPAVTVLIRYIRELESELRVASDALEAIRDVIDRLAGPRPSSTTGEPAPGISTLRQRDS